MAGEPVLKAQDFADYLGRLLGRAIAADDVVQLSSGQQARAGGWLREQGIGDSDLRERLSGPFSAASLVPAGTPTPPRGLIQVAQQASVIAISDGLRMGIDIQRTDELLPANFDPDLKSSSEVTAIFSLREISYAQSRPEPLDTLCGLFAAKEALRKCDASLFSLPLPHLEVLPDASGRPEFRGYALSISHSGGFAIAVAARLSASSKVPLADIVTEVPPSTLSKTSVPETSPRLRTRLMKAMLVTVLLVGGAFFVRLLGTFGLGK